MTVLADILSAGLLRVTGLPPPAEPKLSAPTHYGRWPAWTEVTVMTIRTRLLIGVCCLAPTGAMAQTRTYLIHFDGSCSGMTLHVTNGINVVGNTVGCGDTKRAYSGKVGVGDVASMTSTGEKASMDDPSQVVKLNYVIGIRDKTWVLYETLDGKTEEIGNGFWTKRGPEVSVEALPAKPGQ